MRAGMCVVLVLALAGCESLGDIQATPADGAAVYVREFCALEPADRAELAALMTDALKPDGFEVRCGE